MKVTFNSRQLWACADYIYHANSAVQSWKDIKSLKDLYNQIYKMGMEHAKTNGRVIREKGVESDDFASFVGTGGWHISYSFDSASDTIMVEFLVDPSVASDWEENEHVVQELEL
jgi:hypothetical protein